MNKCNLYNDTALTLVNDWIASRHPGKDEQEKVIEKMNAFGRLVARGQVSEADAIRKAHKLLRGGNK